MKRLKLYAEWKDDCSGKKDYDGPILSVSCRYYPRGGGFLLVNRDCVSRTVTITEGADGIKPSASCSLMFNCQNGLGEYPLVEAEFEGESFAEVAVQVEAWAQEQMDKAVSALREDFA